MNYRPAIGSLLSKLQKEGFTLISADGQCLSGTDREKRQQAKATICKADKTRLCVENSEGISKWLFIVDGCVTCCSMDSGLDTVCEEFSKQWVGKPVPKY